MTPTDPNPADVVGRLRKRAEEERVIQRNNEAVAAALAPQEEAFNRRDGSHNTFAFRLMLDHRNAAKHDAELAADWDEAADLIASLTARAEKAERERDEARDNYHRAHNRAAENLRHVGKFEAEAAALRKRVEMLDRHGHAVVMAANECSGAEPSLSVLLREIDRLDAALANKETENG